MNSSNNSDNKPQQVLKEDKGEDKQMKSNFENYMKMKFYQFYAQNALMDNFQLLFLKKYDKLLTDDEKKVRTLCDYLVQGTSTVANLGSFAYILSNLSITQQVKFNPIRDCRVFMGGIVFLFAMRSAGILFMWSQCENMFFRIQPKIDFNEKVDFYANNINNNLKIFLYRNFY